jgi:hypothetical protein
MAMSSKKIQVFLAVALLMALLAAVASAGRASFQLEPEAKARCTRADACSDSLCMDKCDTHSARVGFQY